MNDKLRRAVISRAAMMVVAALLFYGGYRCIRVGINVGAELSDGPVPARAGRVSHTRGLTLPYLAGGALILGGGVFALMAVTPADLFARMMGPPRLDPDDEP